MVVGEDGAGWEEGLRANARVTAVGSKVGRGVSVGDWVWGMVSIVPIDQDWLGGTRAWVKGDDALADQWDSIRLVREVRRAKDDM